MTIVITIFNITSSMAENTFTQVPLLEIKALVKQAAKDDLGTDVGNIYDISIPKPNIDLNTVKLTVVLLVDGKVFEIVTDPVWPLKLRRNFKGQSKGTHELKIIIEGQKEKVLGSFTQNLTVK